MADEVAAKLFQAPMTRFEDSQLRMVVSTKVFNRSLEPLVAKTRFEVAEASGITALEELKRNILYELERVEAALARPQETRKAVNPNADQVTMLVTLARQEKDQAGYAYFSHRHTSQIRQEREERAKWKTCEREASTLEKDIDTVGITSPSALSHDSPYM